MPTRLALPFSAWPGLEDRFEGIHQGGSGFMSTPHLIHLLMNRDVTKRPEGFSIGHVEQFKPFDTLRTGLRDGA